MKTLNRVYSEYLARTVRGQPRECWRNAFTAVACMDEPGATYVEGWLVVEPGIVIEHGWIEIGDQIIDPTLYANPVLWVDPTLAAESYFAGVRYSQATVEDIVRKSSQGLDLPVVWGIGNGAKGYRFGWGGTKHQGYCQARDAAFKSIGFDAPSSAPFYSQMVQRMAADERKVTGDGAA